MKPNDIKNINPMNSIFRKVEYETIAQNIAIILSRTKNKFQIISWEFYKKERLKDRNFSEIENKYFDAVIKYFKSEDTIRLFSQYWDLK
jgi:hypothetical protein